MTGDGSDTTLTLTSAPVNENATVVTIDGVVQHKDTYSVSGTTLTFSEAPPNGTAVECITWVNTTVSSSLLLEDADSDTKVQVEESADEDKIRFDTGGTERMIIDDSGQVGIGTSSPDSILHISGGASGKIILEDNSSPRGNYIGISSSDNLVIAADEDNLGTSSSIRFRVDASERMRINSSGNVGIGTTSPDWNLQVESGSNTVLAITSGTTSNAQIRFGDSGDDNIGMINYDNSSDSLAFTTNASERMRIDSSGNVGIGTASPSQKLEILDTSNAKTRFAYSSSVYGEIGRKSDGNYEFSAYENGANILFGTSTTNGATTERMRIDSSGNVGIGATSPSYRFVIDNVAEDDDLNIQLKTDNSRQANIFFGDQDANFPGYIGYNHASNFMLFSSNGSERMRIDSSGNLLVGTTSTTINSSNFGIGLFADGRPKFSKNVSGSSHVMNVYGNAGEFRVYGDGDVQNTNNSYGQISDERLKENIVDATDKLNEINQVRIRNFNFIGDDQKQIGVIAQELETIFPSMVKTTSDTDSDGNDLGTETKSVKYSVFVPILIKALQEADDKIDALEARIEALEA